MHEGTWRGEPVAVKKVLVSTDQIGSVLQEVRLSDVYFVRFTNISTSAKLLIMSSLVHPNILAVRGFVTEPTLGIVMDLAPHGDLHHVR